jgi:outer membrane receptor protein involved in Fe transport
MRKHISIFLSVVALLAVPPGLLAQSKTTGHIVGTVSDETGAILPGVNVTLTGAKVAGTQTFVTDDRGAYRFPALPPGQYDITFELSGFATLIRKQIVVSVGGTVPLNVVLQLSDVAETVTVIGETPVVDTRSTHLDTTYDREWVENAPTRRFVFFDYVNQAPGISQADFSSSRSNVMGSGGDENTYQLDGTDITTPMHGISWPWPDIDVIEEVEVLSLGAPAEYGNAAGAVFNIVTRQGTNDFHGDVNFYIQTQGLTDRNTTDEVDDGFPFNRDKFQDFTAQVGGPIAKDKLWFFAGYQYQRNAFSEPGVDPRFPTREENDRVMAKLNYQINHENKIMFMYHTDWFYLPWDQFANDAPSTVAVENGKAPAVNLTYTGVLSENTLLEGRFSGFWSDGHQDPIIDGQPRVMPRFVNFDTGEVTGGTYGWYDADIFKTSINGKVTHYAQDFLGGDHDFKFGVQWFRGGVKANIQYNDYIYTYSYEYYGYNYTYTYGYRYDNYAYSGVATALGVFIDDSWKVNDRLSLNLGVRYDHRRASADAQEVRDENGNATGEEFSGIDNLYTWNPVSPRLGFNYQLTADGKTVIKAHYGRYYRQIITCEYCTNVGSSPHGVFFGAYDLENQEFLDLELVELIPFNVGIDPNYRNPYTDQFIVGFERELAPELALQLNYAHKEGRDYARWVDIAGVYEDTVYIDDQGADATGAAIPVQRLLSDPVDRFFQITNSDEMNTSIDAFTVQVVKRMAGNWQLTSSLSYLSTDGTLAAGREGADSDQFTALSWSDFGQNPNDLINAGGRLPGERPWMFKTQFLYQFPHDFLVAVNYIGQSGKAWPRQVQIREPDLGLFTEINAEERDGSRRVEAWNLLDVRVQKLFRLGRGARIGLFLDALNLFNEGTNQNVLDQLGTSESFGLPSFFLPPRRLMLGAKFQF